MIINESIATTLKPAKRREDEINILPPGTWENDDGPADWYAVSDYSGIRAYAGTENLALAIAEAMYNYEFPD